MVTVLYFYPQIIPTLHLEVKVSGPFIYFKNISFSSFFGTLALLYFQWCAPDSRVERLSAIANNYYYTSMTVMLKLIIGASMHY